MQVDDKIVSVGGYTGTEQPPSTEIIELIKTGFIEGARKGEYKATALVYDVRVNLPETGEKSDAISVSLNHRENYSVTVIFPYKIENGKLVFGTTYAHKGEADIFLPG